jgi:hypothetical protein
LLLELLYAMDADTHRPGRLPIAIERGRTRLPTRANYFFNYKKIRTSLTQQDNYKKIEVKKLKVLIDSRKKKDVDLRDDAVITLHKKNVKILKCSFSCVVYFSRTYK